MAAMPTVVVLEQFISQNDPFTRTRLMHVLSLSEADAEKSIRNLLDLGVIRLLDPQGARSYYTRAVAKEPGEPAHEAKAGEKKRIAVPALQPTPQMQRGPPAQTGDECIQRVLSVLDSFSKDDAAKLGVLYAAERELLGKRRGRR